tara:strand:- start:378 stop:548 length:171 start_codon:yes stop_codon:yes gene_type:complete
LVLAVLEVRILSQEQRVQIQYSAILHPLVAVVACMAGHYPLTAAQVAVRHILQPLV